MSTSPPSPRKIFRCGPGRTKYLDPIPRVQLDGEQILIYAWPSRGGVIVHDHADGLDLDFLGLDRLDPPLAAQLDDRPAEDVFAARLLLLGAKWWDSYDRFALLHDADEETHDAERVQAQEELEPWMTARERRWVCVGWPTAGKSEDGAGAGGLWVAEFETMGPGWEEGDDIKPQDTARLRLARTMDERCEMLKTRFGAKFHKSLEDYDGLAFLKSWETKDTGEVGPLEKENLRGTGKKV
ncbi:MAG: hypothetical protein M1814_001155 [Vezdaea aestivalis]|nr:MAG: hypothetical protein M1814_001155 [Vezdaea aestivalis]